MTMKKTLSHSLLIIALFATTFGASFNVSADTLNPVAANELKEISVMAEGGQQAAALDRINNFLNANPNEPQAMFMKGLVLVELNRREDAIKAFTDLSEKHPNLPEPYNNLAVLYADSGQYEKSKKALETAIKTHPSYATAHENLGDIYARMASEAYDKALQLDNSNSRAQNKLSMIKDLFGNKPMSAQAPTVASKVPAKTDVAKVDMTKPVAAKTPNGTQPIRPADKKLVPAKPVIDEKLSAPTDSAPNNDKAINDAVAQWAKAWSSQDIDAYLASYANSFKPAKGQSKKEWEQTRRDRISRPKSINVEVADTNITMDGDSKAKVSFKQTYRADGKPQSTAKTLLMSKKGDAWLIEQELAAN